MRAPTLKRLRSSPSVCSALSLSRSMFPTSFKVDAGKEVSARRRPQLIMDLRLAPEFRKEEGFQMDPPPE